MDPATNSTIVTAAVFIGVIIVMGCVFAAFNLFSGTQRQLVKRVDENPLPLLAVRPLEAAANVRRIATDNSVKGLELLARRLLPRPAELRKRLSQTGMNITLANYMVGEHLGRPDYRSARLGVFPSRHRDRHPYRRSSRALAIPHIVVSS